LISRSTINCRLGVRADARFPGRQELLLFAVAALAASLALAIVLSANDGGTAGARAAARATKVVELPQRRLLAGINSVRRSRGLRDLVPSNGLTSGARERALSMAREGYFGHTSPQGTPFWRDLQQFYPSDGFSRWSVGENLLWSVSAIAPDGVVRSWLASPEHATVLLSRKWTQVGVETIRALDAPGAPFGNRDVTIVVAEFGVRTP
jgi:uncharacterized protein YkwD